MTHTDWLENQLRYKNKDIKISELGKIVSSIMGEVWDGIYHLDRSTYQHERTDWSNNSYIEMVICGELATWDFNKLTRLVVLCHDKCVRLSISGASNNFLRLMFHKREREGGFSERHPTLEYQVEQIRMNG